MSVASTPLPEEFLEWQVQLRRHTMHERNGAPHIGVVPLLFVHRPGVAVGGRAHSIVCGLLPAASQLEKKTQEFRGLYEDSIEKGARHVYDRGIDYLLSSPGAKVQLKSSRIIHAPMASDHHPVFAELILKEDFK